MTKLLEPLIERAIEDGIINMSDVKLLSNLRIQEDNVSEILSSQISEQTFEIVNKIFLNTSEVLINKNKSMVLKTVKNGKFIWDLLFSSFFPLDERNKFIFKITIMVEDKTDISEMLSTMDNIYCIRTEVDQIKSGLCLGTKHFLIDNNEVGLLAFAKKKDNTSVWVERGSYAELQYVNPTTFSNTLRRTAQNLLANYYAKHAKSEE